MKTNLKLKDLFYYYYENKKKLMKFWRPEPLHAAVVLCLSNSQPPGGHHSGHAHSNPMTLPKQVL